MSKAFDPATRAVKARLLGVTIALVAMDAPESGAGAGEAAGGTAFAAFGAPSCGTQAAAARSSGMVIDTRTVWPKLMCVNPSI